MKTNIPIYQPELNGNEKKYVLECLETNWISSKGKFVSKFESEFAKYLNVGYATSVSNGTVALHLALHTLGIGPGDEVIVPTLTYIASVNAIDYVGATPVFVDAEPSTWNIDVNLIAEKITSRTKAILVVHLYGAPCNMDALADICIKHNLLLIEDVAEAFGTKYKDKFAGSFGDISTFSFFGNKTITTGEGGMLISNKKELITRAAYFKSQAVSPVREYWHDEIGFNFRMTNICAAIGVAQLEQADKIIQKKRALAAYYKNELKNTNLVFQEETVGSISSYWMVSILAKDEKSRDLIRLELKKSGVENRPLFYPAHTMPVFRSTEKFPVAEELSRRGMNLPSYPGLSRENVKYICDVIKLTINKTA